MSNSALDSMETARHTDGGGEGAFYTWKIDRIQHSTSGDGVEMAYR